MHKIDMAKNDIFALVTTLLSKQLCKTRTSHTVQFLLHPDNKQYRTDGIWHVQLGNLAHEDLHYWTVVHWPLLAQRILDTSSQIFLQHSINPYNVDASDLARLLSDIYLKKFRLPGTEYRRSDLPFMNLIAHLTPEERSEEFDWAVYRCGDQIRNRFNALEGVSKAVLERTPLAFRLLYIALQEASLAQDPFDEWGLLWGEKFLYFHYGRALDSVRRDIRYNQTVFRQYDTPKLFGILKNKDAWSRVRGYAPPLHLKKAITYDWDYQEDRQQLMLLNTNWEEDRAQGDKYSPLRQLIFDVDKLVTYIETLAKASADFQRYFQPPRKKSTFKAMPRPPGLPMSFSVDLAQLGYTPFEEECNRVDSVIGVLAREDTYYLSLPMELTRKFTDLTEKKYYVNTYAQERGIVTLTDKDEKKRSEPIPRVHLNKATRCFTRDGVTYFHPSLLEPYGEVVSVVDALLRLKHGVKGTDSVFKRLEAFSVFLQWVHDPVPIKSQLGRELGLVVGADHRCPVKLITMTQRLKYLYDFASYGQKKNLAYYEERGRHARSPAMTDYDRFAVWYFETYELENLPVKLTRKQRAEYIVKRWLPWRQIPGVYPLLSSQTGQFKGRKKLETLALDPKHGIGTHMDCLLQKAEELYGPTFLCDTRNYRMGGI